MIKRKKRGARDRAFLATRDGHKCRLCQNKSGPFDIDHIVPIWFHRIDPERWPLARLEANDNLRLLCGECHARETAKMRKIMAKITVYDRRNGLRKPKQKRPMAGSRNSPWKRTMKGKTVKR